VTTARPVRLLASSVKRATARIAFERLEAAADAAERLAGARDDDALHDFRVALRRLRSVLRAYEPWLGKAASRKMRERLRAVARETNESRDAEVRAAWIRRCKKNAPPGLQEEFRLLLRGTDAVARPRPGLRRDFDDAARKLRQRLREITPGGPRFRPVFAGLVKLHVEDAERRLSAVLDAEHSREAHRARIAVKRLRYLLEAAAVERPELGDYLKQLSALQDVLGGLHDAHVYAAEPDAISSESGESAVQALLRRRNMERCVEDFGTLRAEWLGGRAQHLFSEIRKVAFLRLAKN
jgi:CHAD domain-containing protein